LKNNEGCNKGKTKIKIFFLCTGNSCRSQMAEGFARHFGGDIFDVYSAGISPAGVNPLAVQVMQEAGIDISKQTSDPIDLNLLQDAHLIITLCGDARESCPVVPGKAEKRHWSLNDPAKAEGNKEEVLAVFRKVRDQIYGKVLDLVEEFKSKVKKENEG
jgi:arsenate reductase